MGSRWNKSELKKCRGMGSRQGETWELEKYLTTLGTLSGLQEHPRPH